jgi:DNA-binding CsgD family transcriptional regulator/tetratricopeptide (TPR) repeat protein
MHLLERQEQLAIMQRCFADASAGSGKLVLIIAEAGFGKSSLVEQFVSGLKQQARVLWGACDALGTPRALGAVHEIAAQTPIFDDHITLPNESRDWLFGALFSFLTHREPPTVVVLEDLHWADESTLDFFRFIGRRIQRTNALFIATYREEELPPMHPARLAIGEITGRHAVRIRLPALSASAVAELAKDSGRDAARLYQITGGNPFFVCEALASADGYLPETVRDAVLARLMRCSDSTRELAELVSVSPGRTEGWLIESFIGAYRDSVDEGVARGLLTTQGDAVSFRHELARLAVHSTFSPERLRALHERVLQVLVAHGADFSQLVHHATLAKNAAAILKYAPLAARQAARLGAHRESAAHLKTALRHCDSLPTMIRAELFEQHARECSLTNQTNHAIESATRALSEWRQMGDIEAQSRVLSFLAPEYRMSGDKARADESIAEAIALLEPLPPSAHLAMAYSVRSRLASNRGLDREAVDFGERALDLARQFGDFAIESHALNNIGAALLIAGELSGYAPLEQSLAVALEKNLEECAARAYCNLVFCAVLGHDFVRADRYIQEGIAYCEEHGLFASIAYIRTYEARLALDRGDWTDAAQIAGELKSADLVPVQQVPTLVTLALVRIRRGDPGADEVLEKAYDLAFAMGEPERIGRVTAARAEQAWYRGDLERTASEASRGLKCLADLRFPWVRGELLFWQSRAQVADSNSHDIAPPYRLMLAGDWQGAAAAWEAIGMPYEQALSLAQASDEELLRSLAMLEKLGAGPHEVMVRRRLRERGVRGVPRGPREATRANPAGLSAKEIEVLALLIEGRSNAQIARLLHRSTKTIDHHVSAVLGKLGVHSRAAAITAAFGLGIVGRLSGAAQRS